MKVVETDVLVVGAGPAGLTVSALLARAAIKAIGITKYRGTLDLLRAEITHQRSPASPARSRSRESPSSDRRAARADGHADHRHFLRRIVADFSLGRRHPSGRGL
jgi:malic enzyme